MTFVGDTVSMSARSGRQCTTHLGLIMLLRNKSVLRMYTRALQLLLDITRRAWKEGDLPTAKELEATDAWLTNDWQDAKCKSQTFQHSYFMRVTRVWNTLPEKMRQRHISLSQFKNMLLKYYDSALRNNYCVDDPRTWKSIFPKCNIARNLSGSLTCCAWVLAKYNK